MLRCRALLLAVSLLGLVTIASGQQAIDTSTTSSGTGGTESPNPGSFLHSNHVVVIMEENRDIHLAQEYMPYLNSLADQYAQGLNVYSDSHGSWLAYGELTSGMHPFHGSGDNGICNGDGCSQTITIDNLVRHFVAQGKTWKGYFQSMPTIGYLGYSYGEYVRRHNAFAFYSDVVWQLTERWNLVPTVPFLLQDIANNRMPNFVWITPDLLHDAHDGIDDQHALAAADQYLQTFLPQLLATPAFQPGGDGVLMVTFDEGELSDQHCGTDPETYNCGGHIWHVLIGPRLKRNYQSSTHYMQGSQLRLICDLMGVLPCPGDGATSPGMSEFFQ